MTRCAHMTRGDLLLEIERLDALLASRYDDALNLAYGPAKGVGFKQEIHNNAAAGTLAECFLRLLASEEAPNFVEVQATHPEAGELCFAVYRRGRGPLSMAEIPYLERPEPREWR